MLVAKTMGKSVILDNVQPLDAMDCYPLYCCCCACARVNDNDIIKKVYNLKWFHTFHAIETLRVKELSREERQFEDLVSWIEKTTNYCDGAIFVSGELLNEGKKHYNLKSTKIIPNAGLSCL